MNINLNIKKKHFRHIHFVACSINNDIFEVCNNFFAVFHTLSMAIARNELMQVFIQKQFHDSAGYFFWKYAKSHLQN